MTAESPQNSAAGPEGGRNEPVPTIEQLEKNIRALVQECDKSDDALRKTQYSLQERIDVLQRDVRALQRPPIEEQRQKTLEGLFQRLVEIRQQLDKLSPLLPPTTPLGLAALQERDRATKEGAAFVEQYAYSPERFRNRSEYIQYLARNLTNAQRINDFLRYMYRYSLEHDNGQRQEYVNTSAHPHDLWLQPHESVTRYNHEGRFTGDCEDIALLFQEILSRQGKNAFEFMVPDHALMGWFERSGDRVTAFIIDTTNPQTRNAQAHCRQLQGDPGESEQSVFSRLLGGFISRSDSRANVDVVNQINLGFLFPDGRAFNLPATFSLTQRYGEIRELLRASNYQAMLKILNAELQTQPGNTHLLTARLQLMRLMGADAKMISEQVQTILGSINPRNIAGRMELMNVNLTAYSLAQNGMLEAAIQLQRGALERWDRTRYCINEHDTLSDLYLQAGQFSQCYTNDVELMGRILRIDSLSSIPRNLPREATALALFESLNRDMFVGWLRDRYGNKGYREYIEGIAKTGTVDPNYRRYVIGRERLPDPPEAARGMQIDRGQR